MLRALFPITPRSEEGTALREGGAKLSSIEGHFVGSRPIFGGGLT
jgi:hypothetical protein